MVDGLYDSRDTTTKECDNGKNNGSKSENILSGVYDYIY